MTIKNRRPAALLIGNTTVPRSVTPLIRASQRRSDPDIVSTIPYYPVSGKSLQVIYTDSSYVEQTRTISFSSDGYGSILSAINAADAVNLVALDQDGFLAIRNLNSGGRHYLKVMPCDSAEVFGFAEYPAPGSISYAGEFSSTPGVRSQRNPQGVALLGKDEDLSSAAINRAIAAVLQWGDLLKVDLDRDVIGFVQRLVTFEEYNGVRGFYLDEPALRLPVNAMGLSEDFPTGGVLEPFFEFVDSNNGTLYTADLHKMRVTAAYYHKDESTPYVSDEGFAVWGVPDSKSIYQPGIGYKIKNAAAAITSIIGGVVYCEGEDFVSAFVQKGDPILIAGATNTSPFDHNGWFVVDEVVDAERLLLRAMSTDESVPTGTTDTNKPAELNPTGTGFGNLSVHFGGFVPCSRVYFELSDQTYEGVSGIVRMAVGKPLRDVLIDSFSYGRTGSQDSLGAAIYNHLVDTSDAHAASAIGGFTSATAWKDGTTITGATLKATIEDILTDLANITAGQGGTRRVGGDDITISGAAPNNLVAAGLRDQLVDLLTKLQTHVLDHDAHAGGTATFTKDPAGQLWMDGTTITDGINIIQAITNIITVLGGNPVGSNGAAKINTGARSTWKGGRTNPANVSILAAISKIIDDLAASTDLDDGAERVGAATMTEAGQPVCGDSLRTQLNYLATMWAKMSRANTFDATQTLNGPSGDPGQTNAAIITSVQPVNYKLLWEISAGAYLGKVRIYSANPSTLEIVVNAYRFYNGSIWVWKEDTNSLCTKLKISNGLIGVYTHPAGDDVSDSWADTRWRCVGYFGGGTDGDTSPLLNLGLGWATGYSDSDKRARGATPRIGGLLTDGSGVPTVALLQAWKNTGSDYTNRVYAGSLNTYFTHNCRWDEATSSWYCDNPASRSTYVDIGISGISCHKAQGSSVGIALVFTVDCHLFDSDDGAIIPVLEPAKDDGGYGQTLTTLNLAEAWGRVDCQDPIVLTDGFNITGITYVGDYVVRVDIGNSLGAAANYVVLAGFDHPNTSPTSALYHVGAHKVDSNTIDFFIFDEDGLRLSLTDSGYAFYFVVFGR
jgi:hypothetical protein